MFFYSVADDLLTSAILRIVKYSSREKRPLIFAGTTLNTAEPVIVTLEQSGHLDKEQCQKGNVDKCSHSE